jgi:hypothetical protein
MSLQEFIELLVSERFEGDEAEEDSIQSIERFTWLRWLFFILGSLPAAIKLAVMKGVPWTNTWGMMFLASFLAREVLIIVVAMTRSNIELAGT